MLLVLLVVACVKHAAEDHGAGRGPGRSMWALERTTVFWDDM